MYIPENLSDREVPPGAEWISYTHEVKQIFDAAGEGDIDKLSLFLSSSPFHIDTLSARYNDLSLLHHASRLRRPEAVELLLQHKASVNGLAVERASPSDPGCWPTPLLQACTPYHHLGPQSSARDQVKTVKTLLHHGADVRARGRNECDALQLLTQQWAYKNQRLRGPPISPDDWTCYHEIVLLLLDAGAELNQADPTWYTALQNAVSIDDLKTTQLLLERGAKPVVYHFARDSPLALTTRVDVATTLIEYGAQVCPDAIQHAAFRCCDLLELYLTHAAPTAIKESHNALHHAVDGTHASSVDRLLIHGFDINARVHKDTPPWHGFSVGDTPLLTACRKMNASASIIELLLDHGADHCSTNAQGDNCLHLLAAGKRLDLVKSFLDLQPSMVQQRDSGGRTPLMIATNMVTLAVSSNGHPGKTDNPRCAIISMLMRAGSDLNAANARGQTCLHMLADMKMGPLRPHVQAELECRDFAASLLLESGARVDILDAHSETPSDVAKERWRLGGERMFAILGRHRHGKVNSFLQLLESVIRGENQDRSFASHDAAPGP